MDPKAIKELLDFQVITALVDDTVLNINVFVLTHFTVARYERG